LKDHNLRNEERKTAYQI